MLCAAAQWGVAVLEARPFLREAAGHLLQKKPPQSMIKKALFIYIEHYGHINRVGGR